MTDAKALTQLQSGDQQALEWFIDRYGNYVGTVVNSVLQNCMSREDVEEVAADALAHFRRMETESHQLLTKIKQLEAELHDVKMVAMAADALCDICKHKDKNVIFCEVHDLICSECSAACACKECYPGDSHYEWRGI